MMDITQYTPSDVPSEILAFDGTVSQLGVGKSGKAGLLKLVLIKATDKTLISEQVSEAPLHLQKALHYEQDFPAIAYLYMASSSGGILQGDRYRIDITMKENSIAHITTQGATRIYSMNANSATQMVNLTLEKGSYLEFIPDQIIPYKNSRFYQKMNLNVDEDATLVYSEVITPGRVAMGESFDYDICYLRTVGKNQDDKLLFSDVSKLEPAKQMITSFGILGENAVIGTVYIISKDCVALEEKIGTYLNENELISCGSSILPHDSGVMIRILGQKTEDVKEAIFQIAKIVRRQVIDAPFSSVRKA
jgi:urease accessory protein